MVIEGRCTRHLDLVTTQRERTQVREVEVARAGYSLSLKNVTPTGAGLEGARRARKVDRRLGSGCVGSAAVGSELWPL